MAIRRAYLYAISFISIETVLWGVITLTRITINRDPIGARSTLQARALALILVAAPVFLVHWWLAQRANAQGPQARLGGERAVFLYAMGVATLLPIAQNVLALVNRALLLLFQLNLERALFGANQGWTDNLVAMIVNIIAAAYFYTVLSQDWQAQSQDMIFPGIRRVYRYFWVGYGLAMSVFGARQALLPLLGFRFPMDPNSRASLVNGLAMVVVGLPIWWISWRVVQSSLRIPVEKKSVLRLGFLYLLNLLGVVGVLGMAARILAGLLRWALRASWTLEEVLAQTSPALAFAMPMVALWAYYGQIFTAERSQLADKVYRAELQRRFYYALAAFGLAGAFIGLQRMLSTVIDVTVGEQAWGALARTQLATGIAIFGIGLPLWLVVWRPLRDEAAARNETGDHARRSIARKGFLFLALFTGVLGTMFSAGGLLFQLLISFFDEPRREPPVSLIQSLVVLSLFLLLAIIHWRSLQADDRLEERSLAEHHARFPVLVLDSGDETFVEHIVSGLQNDIPTLPVAAHKTDLGVPGETMANAKAVILPSSLAANPPEAMRLWLDTFTGVRLVVPVRLPGWVWLNTGESTLEEQGRQVIRTIRQLAEGEGEQATGRPSAWLIIGYVTGGALGLTTVLGLIWLILSGWEM